MGLVNTLVAGDLVMLNALSLTGLVPAMAYHASSKWPRSLRLHAAVFLHALCHASDATLQLVVACRVCGLPATYALLSRRTIRRLHWSLCLQSWAFASRFQNACGAIPQESPASSC